MLSPPPVGLTPFNFYFCLSSANMVWATHQYLQVKVQMLCSFQPQKIASGVYQQGTANMFQLNFSECVNIKAIEWKIWVIFAFSVVLYYGILFVFKLSSNCKNWSSINARFIILVLSIQTSTIDLSTLHLHYLLLLTADLLSSKIPYKQLAIVLFGWLRIFTSESHYF